MARRRDEPGGAMMELVLPIVYIVAETLPEAWEQAVLETWQKGAVIATQYDKPGDPPSRDAAAVIVVKDPFKEPRIHRAIPCGLEDLESYRQEVVDGIHDHWIDPAAGKWEYTYHERLVKYPVSQFVPGHAAGYEWVPDGHQPRIINQIDYIVNTLVGAPHSRRAQAIIWDPSRDCGIGDPPCLQSIWCRIFGDELVMNIRIRSNDAFKAAFMNMFAFTDLQRVVAECVSERLGRTIRPGQYNHFADSFHIYGSYFDEFKKFLELSEGRSFDQRVYRTEDVQAVFDEARQKIAWSLEEEARTGRKGVWS